MTRIWVYTKLTTDTPLAALINTQVYQSTSLVVAPSQRPFVLYRQTSDVQSFRGDDGDRVRQSGFMIFAHDIPGDYLRIDTIMDRFKILFGDTSDSAQGIVRSTWLEDSEDLRDDDMGTITRFARILVKYKV